MEEDEVIAVGLVETYLSEFTANYEIQTPHDKELGQLSLRQLYYVLVDGLHKFIFMIDKDHIEVLNKLDGVQRLYLGEPDGSAIKAFIKCSLV